MSSGIMNGGTQPVLRSSLLNQISAENVYIAVGHTDMRLYVSTTYMGSDPGITAILSMLRIKIASHNTLS